jgi:hypothetical protein
MTTYSFPALGFDPAPGNPDEVEGVGRHCARAARALEEDAARLEALQRSQWVGEASDALRARVARLRRDYSSSGRAYGALSVVLLHFSEVHRQAQIQARRAEDDAAEAKRRMEVLEREVERLEAELKSAPSGAEVGPVLQELMDTRRRWSWADESYQSARATAERIQSAFEDEGNFAVRRLRAIDPPPYQPPRRSLFHQATGCMGDRVDSVAHAVDCFVDEHTDLLGSISGALKAVSAVAGLLSFIPVLTPICVPLAAGTAVAALGLDATLVASGHGTWKAVAVDAGLMALPVAGRLASRAITGGQAGW